MMRWNLIYSLELMIEGINGKNIDQDKVKQGLLHNVQLDTNTSKLLLQTTSSTIEINHNKIYENYADEIINEIWKIFKDEHLWLEEMKSIDGFDIVVSKYYPKWGKIFRLTVR